MHVIFSLSWGSYARKIFTFLEKFIRMHDQESYRKLVNECLSNLIMKHVCLKFDKNYESH